MSNNRYDNRVTKDNFHKLYDEVFENRGVSGITQYTTPVLRYPTVAEIQTLTTVTHTWKYGDKYYKVADKYYGDSKLWWVIAWYNKSPTEAHNKLGDLLYIPFPLEKVYEYFGL